MKFKRRSHSDGAPLYYAKGTAHSYYVTKSGRRRWQLLIFKLDSLKLEHADDSFMTKADALAVARRFETLGDDYRSSAHGHMERYTYACVTR